MERVQEYQVLEGKKSDPEKLCSLSLLVPLKTHSWTARAEGTVPQEYLGVPTVLVISTDPFLVKRF